ncbi:uncharacterized protein LOC130719543 [Lotus japonicus]|uniref:uncharacterized protein LOC130719543 n=1 Tax=Lotus japonicus TaxID=34305 RepID=UPI00258BCA1A|nr:uncharacterized protein LOC130719543 [Lotus japonicus]
MTTSTGEREETIPASQSWCPPPEGFLKVNVDASWIKDNPFCSIGCIVRDPQAVVMLSSCRKVLAPTPLIVETLAIREGALVSHNLGWNQITLESDCKVAIEACTKGKKVGEIKPLVQDIDNLQQQLQHCELRWTPRSSNKVSHLIALLGMQNLLPPGWLWNPPRALKEALIEDARCIPPRAN